MMIIKTVVASNNNLFVASPRKVPAALQRLFVALSTSTNSNRSCNLLDSFLFHKHVSWRH